MCASSSMRCGSCLARWNGKSWVEPYKCVLPLKSWSLVLSKDFQLCVEGYCDVNFSFAVRIPITERLNSFWVTNEHTLVKLLGILDTKKLPDYVAEKFSNGIPTNWKDIVKKWVKFVQKGEKSPFSWDLDDSTDSCDTSVFLTGRRRNVSSGRDSDGRPKEMSVQRIQSGAAHMTDVDKDSAVPSTDFSCQKETLSRTAPLPWSSPSPWLSADKAKEINQWICGAVVPPEPVDADIEVESGCRDSFSEHTSPADSASNSKNRVQNVELVIQRNSEIPQSTPLGCLRDSRLRQRLDWWNLSSIHSNSSFNQTNLDSSFNSNVFQKPKIPRSRTPKNTVKSDPKSPQTEIHLQLNAIHTEVPGTSSDLFLDRSLSDFTSEGVFRKPKDSGRGHPPKNSVKTAKHVQSSSLPQTRSKNSEVPGSRMGRMLSSSIRPRRKQSSQKIERWRPVLGVDGCLKVQGYLLLQRDMTAGQILTTNTVVEWGKRKVCTCDGREYHLVGDPYGKIPDDLKNRLLAPMDCAVITAKLREFQALKDRADWGAEYEYFYDDDMSIGASNPRLSQNLRNDNRTTVHYTPPARQQSRTSVRIGNSQDTPSTQMVGPPSSGRSTSSVEKNFHSLSKSSNILSSESTPSSNSSAQNRTSSLRKSARITRRRLQDESQDKESSRKVSRLLNLSRSPDNNEQVSVSNLDRMNHNLGNCNRNSVEPVRSCFENITWKNTQNQMMLPSPCLSGDSAIVDFSSSRIKVSYISPKSVQKAVQSPESAAKNQQLVMNESFTFSEGSPKSRPSRSPVKRACLPCSEGSTPFHRTASNSPHPVHSNTHKSLPERTIKRVVSPSPLGKRTPRQVLSVPPTEKRKSLRSLLQQTPSAPAAVAPKSATRKSLTSRSPRSSSRRTPARLLRVVVHRMDVKKKQNTPRQSPQKRKLNPPKQSPKRRKLDTPKRSSQRQKQATPKQSPRRQKQATPKQSPQKGQVTVVSPKKKMVTKEKNQKPQNASKKVNKQQKTKKQTIQNKKTPGNKRVATKKKTETVKKKLAEDSTDRDEEDDAASECSNASDISVGPSASVIFALHDSPVSRRAPRTLKERRERDARIAQMGTKLAVKEAVVLNADDDPLANLMATQRNIVLPQEAQEWCKHENFLHQNRKRRRPSSSDGTVSPSGLDDAFGNEDATSSVATPQLLMRPPDPKQVQSYLQRQRALNAKPQRPTRQVRRDKDLVLPHIDYAAAFHPDPSDSEESASAITDPEWDD